LDSEACDRFIELTYKLFEITTAELVLKTVTDVFWVGKRQ
jgi:hypothetical protein